MTKTKITYRQLEDALLASGFSVGETTENSKAFRHRETGALILYPDLPLDDPVLPRHLGMVRAVLQTYGIADPADFVAEIPKSR